MEDLLLAFAKIIIRNVCGLWDTGIDGSNTVLDHNIDNLDIISGLIDNHCYNSGRSGLDSQGYRTPKHCLVPLEGKKR